MVQLEATAVENAEVVEAPEAGVETADTDVSSLYPDDQPATGQPQPEGEGEPADDDYDDADEEGGEPEEAIAAPVSLKAEEKERFAQLPAEAQRMMAEVLSRRDSEVNKGLNDAREAQRVAERTAADQVAQTQRDFADRFERFAQAFAPQAPQREHYRDDMSFLAAREHYRDEMAQFEQLAGQINGMKGEADSHSTAREQEWHQEQVKQLMSVPEFADEATRAEFIGSIEAFGVNDLGYAKEELAAAGAKDIIVLKKAMGWKAKAEKWDAHLARRNERPRQAGKFTAKPAPAGQRNGSNAPIDVTEVLYPNG